jgi:hypothetical protein
MNVFLKGQYIKHSQYGCGVVTDTNRDRTSIDFDVHGMKMFVTSMIVADPAEGTPPKRPRRKLVKKVLAAAATATPGAIAGQP